MTKLDWDAHRFRKRPMPILTKGMIDGFKRDAARFARRIQRRNMTAAEKAAEAATKKPNSKRNRRRKSKARRILKPQVQFVIKSSESHWFFGVTK